MEGFLKWLSVGFSENNFIVSSAVVFIILLVTGDIVRTYHRARRQGSRSLTKGRRNLWYSGVIMASLLMLASLWAYNKSGSAAPDVKQQNVARLSDWDKFSDLLTKSTAPRDVVGKTILEDTVIDVSNDLLARSVTRLDSAMVFIGLEKYDEAITYFDLELQRVTEKGNQPHLIPRILYFRAIANMLVGKDSIALCDVNDAIATDSTYSEAWINRAFLLLRSDEFDEAQYSSEMAMRFARDNTWYCVLGVSYLAHGDWHRAGVYFDSAIAEDPLYAEAHAGKSMVDAWEQNSQKSEDGIDITLAQHTSDAVAWTQKAIAIGLRGDTNGVFESLRHASENLKNVKRKRDSASVESGSAAALVKLGLDDQALMEFSRIAMEYGVSSPEAWYHLARLQASTPNDTNMWQKALQSVDSAIFFNPKSGNGWWLRAVLMNKLSYRSIAVDSCLDLAFGLDSMRNYTEAWLNRGRALHEIGSVGDATASFLRALEASKRHPRLGYRIAIELEGVDSLNAALLSLNRALRAEPAWVEALALKTHIDSTLADQNSPGGRITTP